MASGERSNGKDIKASMAGFISGSQRLLSRQPLPSGADIHDVRVMMKKHRAAVRLVRPLLAEAVYRREYVAGRETGRILSSWRETAVIRKTVKALKKDNPELFLKLWDNETINSLLRKPCTTWEEAGVQAETIREVTERLVTTGHRLRFMSLKKPDAHLLLEELARSHGVAAAAYLACRSDPGPRRLHELRKKAKTFMYQLDYFRQMNASAIKSLERKLDAMTQNLGRYNDLAVLLARTGYMPGASGNSDVANELGIVIRDRQDRYLMKVWPLAYALFAPGKKLQDLLDISF